MNRRELKHIYLELKEKMEELEAAIYSDRDSYTSLNVDYEDVLNYYQANDNNSEEGL